MIDAPAAPNFSTASQLAAQRRRIALLTVLAVIGSVICAGLVVLLEFVSVIVLLSWAVLVGIAWRPRVGLYVVFGLILLFEAGGADPLMQPATYLHFGVGDAPTSPLELLLLLTFAVWLAQGIMRRRLDIRGGRLGWPVLLFTLALVGGLARGAAAGGDMNIALWEARYLFYAVICYFLAANTIRTRQHVQLLTTIALLTMSLFAIEGAYRRIALVDTGRLGVIKEFAYSHETVIYLGALLLLVLGQQVFGAPRWERVFGLLIAPISAYTLLATERRAGYIALMVAFLAITVVFLVVHRKAFFLVAVPVILGGAIYLPLFWNNTSLIGQPARAVRSQYEPDPRDARSNLYRDLEKINVRATIESDPLLGVGFGREFLFAVALPDLSWWRFWRYEPHHNILWVWLKTGAIGFILFLMVMGGGLARAAHLLRTLREPTTRTFALLALAGITMVLVFCYVDLGLVSGRVTVFLGTLLGTLAVLDQVQD